MHLIVISEEQAATTEGIQNCLDEVLVAVVRVGCLRVGARLPPKAYANQPLQPDCVSAAKWCNTPLWCDCNTRECGNI